MLSTVDRVQLAVTDRAAAVANWANLFGAELIGEDYSETLRARRSTIQVGRSLVEFLEPAGDGPVATWANHWREGLYGVVFSTPNLDAIAQHFDSQQIRYVADGAALVIDSAATHGMPSSVVVDEVREPVGQMSHLYEVTNPVDDWQDTAALYTRVFGLDPTNFVRITSAEFGYTGMLTLFRHGNLDRIEITQTSGGGAMDRFFQRRGPSLYMCYMECGEVPALAAHLKSRDARFAPGTGGIEHGLFVHPNSLNGMLMGVSATDYAWNWSRGHESH